MKPNKTPLLIGSTYRTKSNELLKVLNVYTKEGVKLVTFLNVDSQEQNTVLLSAFIKKL